MRRWMIGAMLAVLIVSACSSGGSGGGGGNSNVTGAGGATGAGSTGASGSASSVPNPCELVTSADITKALGDAGFSTTVTDGTLEASGAARRCAFKFSNAGYDFWLDVCTTSACNFDVVRDVSGGDPVSGVGDDAFFVSTCSGPDLLPHDQLFAKAKGLVFQITIGCLDSSDLSQEGHDQALISLMQLAISRA